MQSAEYNEGGFGLIEVLLAVGILAIFLSGTVFLTVENAATIVAHRETLQSLALAQEGLEAALSIRNRGWSNIVNGTYGLAHAAGYWQFSGGFDQQGIFKRTVRIMEVCIPVNDIILSLCGAQSGRLFNIADPNAKRARVTIEWTSATGGTKKIELTSLLANY